MTGAKAGSFPRLLARVGRALRRLAHTTTPAAPPTRVWDGLCGCTDPSLGPGRDQTCRRCGRRVSSLTVSKGTRVRTRAVLAPPAAPRRLTLRRQIPELGSRARRDQHRPAGPRDLAKIGPLLAPPVKGQPARRGILARRRAEAMPVPPPRRPLPKRRSQLQGQIPPKPPAATAAAQRPRPGTPPQRHGREVFSRLIRLRPAPARTPSPALPSASTQQRGWISRVLQRRSAPLPAPDWTHRQPGATGPAPTPAVWLAPAAPRVAPAPAPPVAASSPPLAGAVPPPPPPPMREAPALPTLPAGPPAVTPPTRTVPGPESLGVAPSAPAPGIVPAWPADTALVGAGRSARPRRAPAPGPPPAPREHAPSSHRADAHAHHESAGFHAFQKHNKAKTLYAMHKVAALRQRGGPTGLEGR